MHWLTFLVTAAFTKAAEASSASTNTKLTSEYYTAFLNITFYDKAGEVFHTERTETGRYSSSSVKEVYGQAVELIANLTEASQNQSSVVLDYTGCNGPFIQNWPSDQPWIAIIQRGKCTFNAKIANAVDLKASGVLIYDSATGGGVLQSMKVEPFPIPSVFTYNWKGKEIRSLIQDHSLVFLGLERGSHCEAVTRQVKDGDSESPASAQVLYCTPEETWRQFQHLFKKQSPFWNLNLTALQGNYDFNEKRTSVLFVSVSFIVLMLISLAWLIFYYVQRFRYIHAKDKMERKLSGQAKRALAIIPTIAIKKDTQEEEDNPDTCAVCIENYRVGDIVRILPCNHRFHKNCIDQWLLDRRTCPMCKMDILKHYGLVHDDQEAEDREETMLNLA